MLYFLNMIFHQVADNQMRITIALLTLLLFGAWTPVRAAEDILFEDFETQNNQQWEITGEAFGRGPVEGTLPRQGKVLDYHAERLVNSFLGGDSAQGEMWSPTFTISRNYIRLLVGGGNKPELCTVQLEVDGEVRCSSTGRDSEELLPEWWDVSAWQGRTARIGIIDHAIGRWGHILVDCILFTDGPGSKMLESSALACHRRYQFVPVRFSDTLQITPHPLDYYQRLVGRDWPGISNYYAENSYGQANFEGSKVWNYINLPLPARSYQFRTKEGKLNWDWSKLLNAFSVQVGQQVNFFQCDGVVFFPNILDEFGGGAATWVPFERDGFSGLYPVVWLNPTQGHSVLAHELGHHLQIGHINIDSAPNPMSVMSTWGVNDPIFGGMGIHHTAFHKLKKHWYSPWQIYTALPGSDKVIKLERSALPTNDSDVRVIVVPQRGGKQHYYTIEARKRAGYDRTLPCEGVVVCNIDETHNDRETSLVWPPGADTNKPEQSAWQPGSTSTDAANGLTVSVLKSTPSGYMVRVRVEPH